MEKHSMCRICLAEDVRMSVVTNRSLQEVFEKLTDIPFVTDNSRPMLVCVFCLAKLKQCHLLRKKCLEAEAAFAQMINNEYKDNSVKTQGELKSFGGFVKTTVQVIDIQDSPNDVIKNENPACIQLKEELPNDEIEPENANQTFIEFEVLPTQEDSDDDVPLMNFKTETQDDNVSRHKKKEYRPDCRVIILSAEQQMQSLIERSKSSSYINAPFKCEYCFKGFVDIRAYENHLIRHDERSGSFVCNICRMHYQSAKLLRTHASSAHERIFECNKCGHICHTRDQAKVHDKWHGGHVYECKLCSLTFSKPSTYLTHLRNRHPTEHVCNICGETFVGPHGLQMHKKKTHINGETMVDPDDPNDPAVNRFCSACNVQFYNLDAWKRHILSSVKHSLKTEEERTQCSICPWRYTGHLSLDTHLKEHSKTLRRSRKRVTNVKRTTRVCTGVTQCSICLRRYTGHMSLDTHLKEHSKTLRRSRKRVTNVNERLACAQCGSTFSTRSKLQAHVNRKHLGLVYNKNIVCEVCGKKCTSNATLKYHQRTHTGEKPYACTTCNKHFVDSNQLRIHVRTHTGEKPYVCSVCGRRFSQKPALNRHARVHTGAKPYICQFCAGTFSQSNSLKLHIKTVHLKQPIKKRKRPQNIKTEKNALNP